MRSTFFQPSSDTQRAARRRAITLFLVIAAHVLVLWLVMQQVISPAIPPKPRVASFQLLPDHEAETPSPQKKARRAGGGAKTPKPAAPAARKPASAPQSSSSFASLLMPGLENFDIAKVSSHAGEPQGGGTGAGSGAGSGPSEGPGDGPGGEQLYDPDWYRRPTNAELDGYLPRNGVREGWGLIACRTAEGNRVEDCKEMGESPPGSRFASAVRQAAWQFRILPPRVGGKPLIGVWVRIRIDYSSSGVSVR
jgi:hypothetical protein